MNKTAIKNFAIWARNKLIAEIAYKAGLLGITGEGIKNALPQSGNGTEYYDIGTKEPYAITGTEIKQRQDLAAAIRAKQTELGYEFAYAQIIDEVAYTWFNRLIAIRFMEVNDYLPSRIRVLSSVSGKNEPDIVTTPFEAQMDYTDAERAQIIGWKNDEKLDEAFRYLFLKQCNELNDVLPGLFEKVSDYTELLFAVSFTDKDGVVYHLVHDIPEEDFNIEIGGQVEIIGWLYQYYNTEPKARVFARASGTKIKKEEIPAATQLFTPDWIVRYMVENSLGRLWVEGHPNDDLKANWKYYLEEAEQEPEVQEQLTEIRKEYAALNPEELLCVDPCMGSGHILCYFFDVLMQIYESQGYSQRDAAQSILEHNIWGLDIDDRAYQLAYFAVMMKARQYDRRILTRGIQPHVYAIVESNSFNKAQLKYFGATLDDFAQNNALNQVNGLLEQLYDAKEYGSILAVDQMDWALLREFAEHINVPGQLDLDSIGVEDTQAQLKKLIDVGEALAQKYSVTCTNPPYMAMGNASDILNSYVKEKYPEAKADLCSVFIERNLQQLKTNGFVSMITMQGWMFLSSFEKLRNYVVFNGQLTSELHLDSGAFDNDVGSVVKTVTFVVRRKRIRHYNASAIDLRSKSSSSEKERVFLKSKFPIPFQQETFSDLPGNVFAYWVCAKAAQNYSKMNQLSAYANTRQGMKTGDNERFLRLWFEVNIIQASFTGKQLKAKWYPCNKGGDYKKWYGNNSYVVNWENDGHEIRNFRNGKGKLMSRPQNIQYNFKEGLTWSSISSGMIAMRYSSEIMMFESKGSMCFVNNPQNLRCVQAYLNSKIGNFYVSALSPNYDYTEGAVEKVPIMIPNDLSEINRLAEDNIGIAKQDWDSFETSWDFQQHPLERPVSTIAEAYAEWSEECNTRFNQLKANEEELNRIFIDIYGLQDELTPEVEDKDVTVRKADLQRDVKSLLSYAVGCTFGRYSLDVPGLAYVGGEWGDSKYSTFIPDRDGVIPITDEEYFDDDIVGLLCAWLKKVYGADTLEKNLDFIAAALGNKGDTSREIIRNYFLNDFFKDHCSTYSVTGSGKRPIYWLYDSGKQNGFKALIYLHRYDADTTGRVRANYLHRMEKVYESEISRMTETIENSQNNREVAKATKRREKLQRQLKECREYDEKIAHIALARIEIDLDDGVKVNYRKVQTDKNGKFYEILADSKNIMAKK